METTITLLLHYTIYYIHYLLLTQYFRQFQHYHLHNEVQVLDSNKKLKKKKNIKNNEGMRHD
jgi:hypothetical protein